MRQVLLSSYDITEFVSTIPTIAQSRGQIGSLIINDITQITGINITPFWDTHSPLSPFHGIQDTKDFNIQILVESEVVFDGKILSIDVDYSSKTATVNLQSELGKVLNKGAIFVSATSDTPAGVAKDLLEIYKIPIDLASFNRSDAIYQTDLAFIRVEQPKPDTTVMQLLQSLADLGVARIYALNGIVFFEVFEAVTLGSTYKFTDEHSDFNGISIKESPKIETVDKEPLIGYNIDWVGGSAIVGAQSEQGKSINGGADANIQILSLQAAVFFGELWITYIGIPQQLVSFGIPASIGKFMKLGYPISIKYRERDEIFCDISQIDNSNKLVTKLVCETR